MSGSDPQHQHPWPQATGLTSIFTEQLYCIQSYIHIYKSDLNPL